MSQVLDVSSDWLELRETEDARARSRTLALAAAAMLPTRPIVVHDLGSGTGAMMRWLAPLLPGPQEWVLHDWNASLVERAVDGVRPCDRGNQPIAVRSRVGELAALTAADLEGASLVTASALLDVVTARELQAIVEACAEVGSPVLLSLSVTGRVELNPGDPRDEAYERSFDAHQQRVADGRRMLGPDGPTMARALFQVAGWNVREVPTTWRLDDYEPRLLREWFDGWVDAAVEQSPDLSAESAGYRELRRSQMAHAALSAVIHHVDLLAWPR
ncbi:SAM-dependent methyltransferase [Diaminobutyricibacter tongyongensis]|uniref:SAM-dependent methyltransferase n=1 Tax=Leifsonia tongyongensis TaxID=1268043 RepID=A0A6L9XSU7_9MICO|nr:SAM-dependent methyltransferase [Diaminobutyricibacter tongyongensis]NEN04365.1 SAM-dependent methyltransferase [Diaminobutyricibacter tongyongensis]